VGAGRSGAGRPLTKGDLVASALDPSEWPTQGWREVALLGRSNAGKSTLLNALLGRRAARVSSTPGHTQRLHFFYVRDWLLVDLPGFGYANVPVAVRRRFSEAVDRYLRERQPLLAAILIQDIRRDPEDEEVMLLQWAASRNILFLVAANKADKLSATAATSRVATLRAIYGPSVWPVSAARRIGLEPIRQALAGLGLEGL
jgi:GTP-binding protein